MAKIDIKDAVWTVFQMYGADYKEMDLDSIAWYVVEGTNDYNKDDIDEVKSKVSSYLSNHTSKKVRGERKVVKGELFERVPNGKGSYKKGVYRLRRHRRNPAPRPIPNPITPRETAESSDRNYVGSAGEMAVCSELLFRGYNVSRMSVDDGVDVVAIKNGKTFYIQVKTTQVTSNSFSVTIGSRSFERYCSNDCYYIIVARAERNMFLVFTADDIKRMATNGVISKSERQISISFSQSEGHLYVKNENIDYALNSFERIV